MNWEIITAFVLTLMKGLVVIFLFGFGIATLLHNTGYHREAAGVGFAAGILLAAWLLYRSWFGGRQRG
jgi:hypothetical protein